MLIRVVGLVAVMIGISSYGQVMVTWRQYLRLLTPVPKMKGEGICLFATREPEPFLSFGHNI